MPQGTVKWFDDKKGFGFIAHDGGELFVHCSEVIGVGRTTLEDGARVEFEIGQGRKGEQAERVRVIQE